MITLKKVKINKAMSQETLCFSADVYEDNKLVAHVENNGIGGSTMVYPAKGLSFNDVKHLGSIDNECLIMNIAEKTHIIKTNQSKGFVLQKGDDYLVSKFPTSITKMKKYKNYKEYIQKGINKFESDGYLVLNENL